MNSNSSRTESFPVSAFLDRSLTLTFPHRVYFTKGIWDEGNPLFSNLIQKTNPRPKVSFFWDDGFLGPHPGRVEEALRYCDRHSIPVAGDPVIVQGGEAIKNDRERLFALLDQIQNQRLCRHSYVIAAGGGAFMDAIGFASSIIHRGVRLIRIPTTALGQADSGVGVKNGINAYGQKNFLGTFAVPWAVLNDLDDLKSLSPRGIRDGLVEAVKVFILKDPVSFQRVEESISEVLDPSDPFFGEVIQRSAALHLNHIVEGGDPFESGSARPLDLGHWSAHKLETLSRHRLSHGEAVAVGLALDSLYAAEAGLLAPSDARRIVSLLQKLGFDWNIPELHTIDPLTQKRAILQGLVDFQEHLGGSLSITLPSAIGTSIQVDSLDADRWLLGIDRLQKEPFA